MASLADGPKWSAAELIPDDGWSDGGTPYSDDELELDDSDQLRIGVAGEQRGFPGMSAGPTPAPVAPLTAAEHRAMFEAIDEAQAMRRKP